MHARQVYTTVVQALDTDINAKALGTLGDVLLTEKSGLTRVIDTRHVLQLKCLSSFLHAD